MNRYLIACDFDGTIAATMNDSPNGMNVKVACERTIRDMFGSHGLTVYNEQLGGLKNREPGELMFEMLRGLRISNISVRDAAELFVAQKLRHLVPEIHKQWPRLYPGVFEFFHMVEEGRYPIDVAIVSSGHDDFINRVFEVNELRPPNNIVTSDVLRSRRLPDRPRYKPNTYQLAEAHFRWDGKRDEDKGKPRMVYVGDDCVKDGGLAERSRIPFVHVPFTQENASGTRNGQLSINTFHDLTSMLTENEGLLQGGRDIAEILFGRRYQDMFPGAEGLYNKMLESHRRKEIL